MNILGPRTLWKLSCHPLRFCILEQTAQSWQCRDSRTHLPLFWQAAAQSIRAQLHHDPGAMLEPKLCQVHLWGWTSGWLPQCFCLLSAESSAKSVKLFRAHSTAAAFLYRLTKGNKNLDYLVFPAFGTYSRLIQSSLHCFLCIYYLNTSAAFYKKPFFLIFPPNNNIWATWFTRKAVVNISFGRLSSPLTITKSPMNTSGVHGLLLLKHVCSLWSS